MRQTVLTKRQRKQRGLQKRSALSAKNIVEHAMSECAKQISRNRSMKTDALKTKSEVLNKILFIAVNKAEHD